MFLILFSPQLSLDKPDDVLNTAKKDTMSYAFNGHILPAQDKPQATTPFGEICYTPWTTHPSQSSFNYKYVTDIAKNMYPSENSVKLKHQGLPPRRV